MLINGIITTKDRPKIDINVVISLNDISFPLAACIPQKNEVNPAKAIKHESRSISPNNRFITDFLRIRNLRGSIVFTTFSKQSLSAEELKQEYPCTTRLL